MGNPRRPGGRALRAIAFVAYSVVVVVAMLEVALRHVAPQPLPQDSRGLYRPDATLGWARIPDQRSVVNTGERDVEICTDALGDRVGCERPAPATCARRILVLGDSFTEALAVPFESTVWSRLDHAFGACVAVAGVGAYFPGQYVAQARQRLAPGSPLYDLVILNFYLGNDFVEDAEVIPPPAVVSIPSLRWLPGTLSREGLFNWLYPVNEWLEARSHAYVALRTSMRRILDPEGVSRWGIPTVILRSRLTDVHLHESARSIALVAEAAARAQTPLLVTVIPVHNQVLDPDGTALLARYPALRGDLDMDLAAKRFLPLLQGLPGRVHVVDLLPGLRAHAKDDAWERRDSHFSATGHALWFEAIRGPVAALLSPAHESDEP